jgi:hypothetical protein
MTPRLRPSNHPQWWHHRASSTPTHTTVHWFMQPYDMNHTWNLMLAETP